MSAHLCVAQQGIGLNHVYRDDSEGRVKLVCAFSDDRTGKNRSITDVDWSPKVYSPRSAFCSKSYEAAAVS